LISILYGLASALSWGAGDFSGGIIARKIGAYRAVLYGESVGLGLILIIAITSNQPSLSLASGIFAFIAGAFGTIGLLLLYHALSQGKMSIAGPVSGLLAAALPVLVGIFTEGQPNLIAFTGLGFAFIAVWLISQSDSGFRLPLNLADLSLPILAGIAFGFYFVFIHVATLKTTLWPMVVSRISGLTIITIFIIIRRDSWNISKTPWKIIVLNGILDIGGNIFFILAGQTGRLDIAATLSSLYPAATVLLAWAFLKEKLARAQQLGLLCALAAIALLTH
jgi:drug/metabolite transporter (DMT)-like permease